VRRAAATLGLLLVATTPPATADAGAQQQPPRASAVLSTPSGCPRTRTVRAVVTGREIERVTFSLDGRRVRTLTRAGDGGRWVYSRRTRTLSVGRHRIVARVRFTAESRRSPATLRSTIRRCSPR
jgi:hypothetical protein